LGAVAIGEGVLSETDSSILRLTSNLLVLNRAFAKGSPLYDERVIFLVA